MGKILVKVIFDFEYEVSIKIKNWEIEMPIEQVPRTGEDITAKNLLNKKGKLYKTDEGYNYVFCKVENVDWTYDNGKLILVRLSLKEIK